MADEVYNYARDDVDVPEASQDKLAQITLTRFNAAVRWQSSERVGRYSLRETMRNCRDQFRGLLSPEDQERANAIGVNAVVNLTAWKVQTAQSFLHETLVQADSLPWTIIPTPNPDLPEDAIEQGVTEIMQELGEGQFRGDLTELVDMVGSGLRNKEAEVARERADNMEKLLADQCHEGGWNHAMKDFILDFCIYPFAVLTGPTPTRRARLVWNSDRSDVVTKVETFYTFKSVSPWDFWYSSDSPDTQRGTGIFMRQRWTRRELLEAAKMPSYIGSAIEEVLKELHKERYNFHWLSENPDQPDGLRSLWQYADGTVEVLVHWGLFSGRELAEQGITGLEDLEYYNAQITVIGKHTIQCIVQKNPHTNKRPIFTASFYGMQDRIPSSSIPQCIRDVERSYMMALRCLLSNAHYSSAPIVEADYGRVSKFMTDEDTGNIVPGTVYLAESGLGGAVAAPALKFYSVPSQAAAYQSMLGYFMDLADRVTNIPAALHGTAQGTGANRTFRGAAMLQGNAVKALQAAVANIDETVFGPMGELLYGYNMVYSKDPDIKGDCRIMARGAIGLLQREINRQNAYEVLQMVTGAGQQLMQMPFGAKTITWALKNVLKEMGVPKEILSEAPLLQAQEQPMMDQSVAMSENNLGGSGEVAPTGENPAI